MSNWECGCESLNGQRKENEPNRKKFTHTYRVKEKRKFYQQCLPSVKDWSICLCNSPKIPARIRNISFSQKNRIEKCQFPSKSSTRKSTKFHVNIRRFRVRFRWWISRMIVKFVERCCTNMKNAFNWIFFFLLVSIFDIRVYILYIVLFFRSPIFFFYGSNWLSYIVRWCSLQIDYIPFVMYIRFFNIIYGIFSFSYKTRKNGKRTNKSQKPYITIETSSTAMLYITNRKFYMNI